jgi:hypothetical protein
MDGDEIRRNLASLQRSVDELRTALLGEISGATGPQSGLIWIVREQANTIRQLEQNTIKDLREEVATLKGVVAANAEAISTAKTIVGLVRAAFATGGIGAVAGLGAALGWW